VATVCPFAVDPRMNCQIAEGSFEDLIDFAEALQPSLDGTKAEKLCRLIEKYAACVGTMTFSLTAA